MHLEGVIVDEQRCVGLSHSDCEKKSLFIASESLLGHILLTMLYRNVFAVQDPGCDSHQDDRILNSESVTYVEP